MDMNLQNEMVGSSESASHSPHYRVAVVGGGDGPGLEVLGLDEGHLQLLGGRLVLSAEPQPAQVVLREQQLLLQVAGAGPVQRGVQRAERAAACKNRTSTYNHLLHPPSRWQPYGWKTFHKK